MSQHSDHHTCRFFNARIVKEHGIQKGELWVRNGQIIPPQKAAEVQINAEGMIIAPGYIDLQINGGFGFDFSTKPEQVAYVASQLPQFGVTSFLATLISAKKEQYRALIPQLQPRQGGSWGSSILGIHLEGPFFNSLQIGAHDPSLIQSFTQYANPEEFYGDLTGVKMITLAPEIPGAMKAINFLIHKGILVSVGHSRATFADMEKAEKAGVRMVTHLFNAIGPLHQREPGAIGAVLTLKKFFYSVIADGIHLHPAILELAWKCNSKGLVLVTDAMEALGLPYGNYHLGSKEVEVSERGARMRGTEIIAGSVLSMDKAVQSLRKSVHCSIVDAIEAASWKPAQVLGIEEKKGTLQEGADADFNFLDDDLQVHACYVNGELAWNKP